MEREHLLCVFLTRARVLSVQLAGMLPLNFGPSTGLHSLFVLGERTYLTMSFWV